MVATGSQLDAVLPMHNEPRNCSEASSKQSLATLTSLCDTITSSKGLCKTTLAVPTSQLHSQCKTSGPCLAQDLADRLHTASDDKSTHLPLGEYQVHVHLRPIQVLLQHQCHLYPAACIPLQADRRIEKQPAVRDLGRQRRAVVQMHCTATGPSRVMHCTCIMERRRHLMFSFHWSPSE